MKKAAVVIVVLIAVVIVGISLANANAKNTVIEDIDFSKVADGEYTGEASLPPVSAKTKVVVENGVVVDIDILDHFYMRGKPAESIVDDVIENQTLDVDVVSGATVSSKSILKSIENALK